MSRISRGDYSQAIAKLPVIYLWSLVPLGLAAMLAVSRSAGPPSFTQLPFDPWRAVLYTYLGVVLAVICAGFSLLYVCFVIERRVAVVAAGGPLRIIRFHPELVILFGAILAFVLFHALRMTILATPEASEVGLPLLWLVLLLAVGIVVAYGLIYKGLFKDHAVLRRQVDSLNEAIDTYSGYPAAALQDPEAKEYREYLKRIHRGIERQWQKSDFDPREVGLASPWRRIFGRRGDQLMGPIGFDFLFEPSIVERVGRADCAETIIDAKVGIAKERLRRTEDELSVVRERLTGSAQRLLDKRERRLYDLREQHREHLAIVRAYGEALARCKSAHHVGTLLRSDLEATPG